MYMCVGGGSKYLPCPQLPKKYNNFDPLAYTAIRNLTALEKFVFELAAGTDTRLCRYQARQECTFSDVKALATPRKALIPSPNPSPRPPTQVPRSTKRLRAALARAHSRCWSPAGRAAISRGPVSSTAGSLCLLSAGSVSKLLRAVSRVQPPAATPVTPSVSAE